MKGFHEFQPFYFTRTRIFCSMLRDSGNGIVRQPTPIFHFSVARFSREATLIRDSFIVLLWLYFIYSSEPKIVSIDKLLGSVFNPPDKKVTHILGHSSKKKRLNDKERR